MKINPALNILALLVSIVLLSACGQSSTNNKTATIMDSTKPAEQPPVKTGYSTVNGIKMYYEMYGQGGVPLVLIHGGGSTIQTSFSKMIPFLSQHRQVIAMELQAHGRSEDRDAPETFDQDAEDVYALLQNLHIDSADVLGFSNGGNTTMLLANRHPQQVRKAVVISAFYKRDGMQPWFWGMMKNASLKDMPIELQEAYKKVAIDPNHLEVMHNKDRDRMVGFKDWSDDVLKGIKAPTLIMSADKDVMTPEHAVAMHNLIPNCKLVILPGFHGEFLGEVTHPKASAMPEATAMIIEEFLKEP